MQLPGTFFKHKLKKYKSPTKKVLIFFLYFRKRNFLGLILKNFLYFPTFQETETLKKIPYILGNQNPKKLIFQEKELLNPSSKNKKIHPEKIVYIFLKESSFLYFGNQNPPPPKFLFQETEFSELEKFKKTHSEKTSFVSGNETF